VGVKLERPPVPVEMNSEQTKTAQIRVNGEPREVPIGLTLLDLLRFLEVDPERVAVELNRKIVRQPEWSGTAVSDGAVIEIVQFVGGG
jgi:thiamine biosynthesis protein ThiS